MSVVQFPPFRLDLDNECLWSNSQSIHLRPKTFAVLRRLVEHAGQLLTKSALLEAVWPDTSVSEIVLAGRIRELRQALRDDPKHPQFIETAHRRGYRFIAAVMQEASGDAATPAQRSLVVGRDGEMARLHQALAKAMHGDRQVVFATGEAGLGKTTLIQMFMDQVRYSGALRIGYGHCIEHYGVGEAYMPILEALERLCREPAHQDVLELLKRYAPSCLIQMPGLLQPDDIESLRRVTLGVTSHRMLREIADALERASAEKALVLILEDLHWVDDATLDLISMLARRRQEPARLLFVGTYRPEEIRGQRHSLYAMTQDLSLHNCCEMLPLSALSEVAIHDYLTARLSEVSPPRGLAPFVARRTEGNPLFMVAMLEHLLAQGWMQPDRVAWLADVEAAIGIPDTLRQLLDHQCDQLSRDEQAALEVGSLAGNAFTAAIVAAGLGTTIEAVEAWCDSLVRRGRWLRAEGPQTWPDGTVSEGYAFAHAIYQAVVYDRLTAARRLRLHRCLGDVLEKAYHGHEPDIAGALAVHFDQGQDVDRAIRYRQLAAENAVQRTAYRETIGHLTRAVELVSTLTETTERARLELDLVISLGRALIAVQGNASADVQRIYHQAQSLSQHVGDRHRLFQVRFGVARHHLVRRELDTAWVSASQCLRLARQLQEPELQLKARAMLGAIAFFRGDFASALDHLELQMMTLTQPYISRSLDPEPEPRVHCDSFACPTLWMLGYPEQALQRALRGATSAQDCAHPYSMAQMLAWGAIVMQLRRDVDAVDEWTERLVAVTTEYGYAQWLAQGVFMQGWVLAMRGEVTEGLARMHQGIAAWRATGADVPRPWSLAPLADVYGRIGQPLEGLRLLDAALTAVAQRGERAWEAELSRQQGELLCHAPGGGCSAYGTPEACFRKALEVARRQQAKSWELRAAVSLARLWQSQGKRQDAYCLLAPVYAWFTEGFGAADLQDAKALLDGNSGVAPDEPAFLTTSNPVI